MRNLLWGPYAEALCGLMRRPCADSFVRCFSQSCGAVSGLVRSPCFRPYANHQTPQALMPGVKPQTSNVLPMAFACEKALCGLVRILTFRAKSLCGLICVFVCAALFVYVSFYNCLFSTIQQQEIDLRNALNTYEINITNMNGYKRKENLINTYIYIYIYIYIEMCV